MPLGEGLDDGDLISSSVFPQGKFIRINFDVNGYIVGANIETCILVVNCKKCSGSGGGGSDLDGEEAAPRFLQFPFYWPLTTSRLWHQGEDQDKLIFLHRRDKVELRVFPGGSVVEYPPANAGDIGDMSLIPELERFPGEGNGNPLQYSCLENSMDRGAWRATVQGVEHD